MIKKLLIVLCLFAFAANAQTKKNPKEKSKPAKADTTKKKLEAAETPTVDPVKALEESLPMEVTIDPMTGKKIVHKEVKRRNDSLRFALKKSIADARRAETKDFWVRTKYSPKNKKEPTKLCMNIVSKDTNLVYCVNDSVLIEPEEKKVLFQQQKGDTMYMLIFVDAFNKSKSDGGICGAGHETKLFFTRWNTKTNNAKWKTKNIASCAKGTTNMTKFAIKDWNKSSGPLDVMYNRGLNFYEIRFDPEHPELGLQPIKDDGKEKESKKEE